MKRAYADISEGQIHYQSEGSGEPLLLLHEAPFSSDNFLKVMPILGKSYQVIARDMLGYGRSDPNPPDYRIEDYAQADVSFLNALGIKRASIVGIHTGASIGVEIAAAYPGVVDKLVSFGMPSFGPGVREACIKSYTFSPIEIKEDGSHLISRLWRISRKMGARASPEVRNMLVASAALASGGAYHGENAIFRYNEEVRLPLVKCPTLLISSPEDVFHYRLDVVKSLIPRCQTKIIAEVDGLVPFEKPEEFAQAILDFLRNPGV